MNFFCKLKKHGWFSGRIILGWLLVGSLVGSETVGFNDGPQLGSEVEGQLVEGARVGWTEGKLLDGQCDGRDDSGDLEGDLVGANDGFEEGKTLGWVLVGI